MAKISQKSNHNKNNTNSSSSSSSSSNSNSNSNCNTNNKPTKVKTKRARKSVPRDSPSQRSSIYRGVTRHRWTGRYEAHLWDKNCWNESQSKKGRQVYLGAYDDEEAAAHAYDLAALKYWGQDTILNFPLSNYEDELKEMEDQSKEEYIGSLRRKSSGFSRGVSKYRGVARHHHNGRWEARIGRVFGNKYLYLGTYATQEEAATAYDMAAIEYRGLNAVTNFDLSRYIKCLRPPPKAQDQQDQDQDNNNNNESCPTNLEESNPDHNDEIEIEVDHDMITTSSTPPRSSSNNNGHNATSSSALGFLLQSSKFKEMLERTTSSSSASDSYNNNNNININNNYTTTTFTTTSPPPLESKSNPPRRTFPEDIQTFFESHEEESGSYIESDDIIFGELSSIAAPIFHCELN